MEASTLCWLISTTRDSFEKFAPGENWWHCTRGWPILPQHQKAEAWQVWTDWTHSLLDGLDRPDVWRSKTPNLLLEFKPGFGRETLEVTGSWLSRVPQFSCRAVVRRAFYPDSFEKEKCHGQVFVLPNISKPFPRWQMYASGQKDVNVVWTGLNSFRAAGLPEKWSSPMSFAEHNLFFPSNHVKSKSVWVSFGKAVKMRKDVKREKASSESLPSHCCSRCRSVRLLEAMDFCRDETRGPSEAQQRGAGAEHVQLFHWSSIGNHSNLWYICNVWVGYG